MLPIHYIAQSKFPSPKNTFVPFHWGLLTYTGKIIVWPTWPTTPNIMNVSFSVSRTCLICFCFKNTLKMPFRPMRVKKHQNHPFASGHMDPHLIHKSFDWPTYRPKWHPDAVSHFATVHLLHGSISTVIMTTGFVIGNHWFSTPHKFDVP